MSSQGSLRILIVSDDEADRVAVRRLLRQAAIEAEIVDCSDPEAALDALATGGFDCILLDYHLPRADGVTVLRALRASGHVVPIVALTGQGDEELAVELMKAGAADYLNKNTLTAERLQRSLRYAVALHRAEEERLLLRQREQRARLEAQAANRAKDEFLATLSHELRTPLNAILGWSRLLTTGRLDEETARRAAAIIERNTRLQAQLIEDLLDISRIITGKLRLELRTVAVSSILEGALDSVRPAADAKRIALDVAMTDPDEALLCDPSRMQQAIWNLLSNAVKFTPDGGRVHVSAVRSNESLVLAVADTGVGIAPAFLPYAFDRFRQEDPATTRAHGGLGIGLSIVRHLVELHGGSVKAESVGEGMGSTFTVTVPIAAVERSLPDTTPGPPVEAGSLPSLQGVRVLVVDTEADARALMAAVLESYGATVTLAASASEALDLLARQRPDVLLSDIVMPDEDGYSLIRKVRALERPCSQVPAAALTVFAGAGDRARALLAGYQAHLPKPVEPLELAAVVAALAGRTDAGVPSTPGPDLFDRS